MKVVGEAPTGRSRRLIVTEHGISYGGRPLRKRSAHSSRGSNDPPGWMGEPSQGRRGTGGRHSAAMRYAKCGEPEVTCRLETTRLTAGERSDMETVTLRSERGDWKRAIVRWYLASRLLNLGYPFQYMCADDDEFHPYLFLFIHKTNGQVFPYCTFPFILERISQVVSTAGQQDRNGTP
jgi:hypothetical protein